LKNDGSIRFCIDYRKLNAKTVNNKYPIARSEDLLDGLKNCKYFSVIDLRAAYHHTSMEEGDKPKTAFDSTQGKFQWVVMPFGLTGAAFTLSANLSEVLKDCYEFARKFF